MPRNDSLFYFFSEKMRLVLMNLVIAFTDGGAYVLMR